MVCIPQNSTIRFVASHKTWVRFIALIWQNIDDRTIRYAAIVRLSALTVDGVCSYLLRCFSRGPREHSLKKSSIMAELMVRRKI